MTRDEHEAAARKWLADSTDWWAAHDVNSTIVERWHAGNEGAPEWRRVYGPRTWRMQDWEQHCLERARFHIQAAELLRRLEA